MEFKKHVFPTLTKPGPILLFDFQVVDSALLSKRTRVSFIVELLSRVAEFLAIAGLGELWFGFWTFPLATGFCLFRNGLWWTWMAFVLAMLNLETCVESETFEVERKICKKKKKKKFNLLHITNTRAFSLSPAQLSAAQLPYKALLHSVSDS